MFLRRHILYKSTLLESPELIHGFSTREGGISSLPHTARMNTAFDKGDSDETVRRNLVLFLAAAKEEAPSEEDLSRIVCGPQIHSATVRRVTRADGGQGVLRDVPYSADGYLTDESGVWLLVRIADCVPVLLAGRRADGKPVVAAVHAGWRGTVAGIAGNAVSMMRELGVLPEAITAAIGPSIHDCCYQVGEDFRLAVKEMRGSDFATGHVKERGGALYADLQGMNREILLDCGLREENIDISPACTMCRPEEFHSHRATGGLRGAMAAVIGIRER